MNQHLSFRSGNPALNSKVFKNFSEFIREIDFSSYKRIGVAYSGGVDSTVLIHFLSLIPDCKKKLFALHVNHGISSKSSLWEEHCKNNCLSLEIDFVSLKLEFKTIKK